MERYGLWSADRKTLDDWVEKGQAVPAGKRIFVVTFVFIDENGRILLQQRHHSKKVWPGKWGFSCSGHVDFGETSQQGMERELREELGITIDLTDAIPAFSITGEDCFYDYYVCKKGFDETGLVLQESEVEAVKWATRDEIDRMVESGEFIPAHPGVIDLIYGCAQYPGPYKKHWHEATADSVREDNESFAEKVKKVFRLGSTEEAFISGCKEYALVLPQLDPKDGNVLFFFEGANDCLGESELEQGFTGCIDYLLQHVNCSELYLNSTGIIPLERSYREYSLTDLVRRIFDFIGVEFTGNEILMYCGE